MNEPFAKNEIKIAVIGGGTGSFTLLTALKNHTSQIAAIVNMADDGGSTGVLRDELGALPPGDVRQCLVALSDTPELRDLFNYRFEEGSLKGHALGNLFLTALEKMTGSFTEGVELASRVLNITGIVEPVTSTSVKLAMRKKDGEEVRGEFTIGNYDFGSDARPDFWLEPQATASPRALKAIAQADMVVIAPGNLYGSLAPALIVPGVGEALAATDAVVVYVANLVTKPGQTDNFSVSDFADEIERLAGGPILDAVLYNTETPSESLLKQYAKAGEMSVTFDAETLKSAHYVAAGAPLIANEIWDGFNRADPIAATRTLIRHDSEEVATALFELYEYIDETRS